ncbi:MAG: rod shape determining protein RodA [Myxococcota bacterium]
MAVDFPAMRTDRGQRQLRAEVQTRWQASSAPTRHVDPILIAAAIMLSLIGLLAIYSAKFGPLTSQGLPTDLYVTRQTIALGIGLIAMAVAAAVDYRNLRAYASLLYVGSVLLLVVVLLVGDAAKGAQSWISLGGFQFQPSEVAKIGFIIAAAAFLHERELEGFMPVVWVLGILALPLSLIVLQPDPGTGSILLFTTFVILLVAGIRARFLVALALLGVLGLVGVVQLDLLQDHQIERLTSFANPESEACAQGACYNTDQSLIAIGSGQFAGKGLFQGTQTNLAYVPENHTDFIFTVIGEEFGFVGASVVLALFSIVLYRCLRIAASARDRFGMLMASGVAGLLAFQLFVNVGMTVGIMPVIGIPLPFISYGGTSLIATFTMLGLVLNVHMRRFRST